MIISWFCGCDESFLNTTEFPVENHSFYYGKNGTPSLWSIGTPFSFGKFFLAWKNRFFEFRGSPFEFSDTMGLFRQKYSFFQEWIFDVSENFCTVVLIMMFLQNCFPEYSEHLFSGPVELMRVFFRIVYKTLGCFSGLCEFSSKNCHLVRGHPLPFHICFRREKRVLRAQSTECFSALRHFPKKSFVSKNSFLMFPVGKCGFRVYGHTFWNFPLL